MSRFDASNFSPPPDHEFLCGICMNVLDMPMETPCRHVFCNVCILKALEKKSRCPICRKFLHAVTLKKVLPLVQNVLNNLTLKCEHFEKGCKQLLRLEVYFNHLKVCKYSTVLCEHEGCKQTLLMMDYENHKNNVCVYRRIKCDKGCGLMLLWKVKETHDCIQSLLSQNEELKQHNLELETKLTNLHSLVDGLSSRLSEYETASTPRTLNTGGGGRQQNFNSTPEILIPSTNPGSASGSTVNQWERRPGTPRPYTFDNDFDRNLGNINPWDLVSNIDDGDYVNDEAYNDVEGDINSGGDDYHNEGQSDVEDSGEPVDHGDVSYDEHDENSNGVQAREYNDNHDARHSENVHRESSHGHERNSASGETGIMGALLEEYMRDFNSEEMSSRGSDYGDDHVFLDDVGSAGDEEEELNGENALEENHEGDVDNHSHSTGGSSSLLVAGRPQGRAGLNSDRSYGQRKRAHEDSGTDASSQRAKHRRVDNVSYFSYSSRQQNQSRSRSQRQSDSSRRGHSRFRIYLDHESQEDEAPQRRRSSRLHHEEPVESLIPDVRVPPTAAELLRRYGNDNSSNSSLSSDDDSWSPDSDVSSD